MGALRQGRAARLGAAINTVSFVNAVAGMKKKRRTRGQELALLGLRPLGWRVQHFFLKFRGQCASIIAYTFSGRSPGVQNWFSPGLGRRGFIGAAGRLRRHCEFL